MREIVARYPQARSAMLPCLHLAQDELGLRDAGGALLAVAEAIGVKPDEVESVVTFYSMYPPGAAWAHVIKVCTSISCYLRGCDDVMAHLEERLGVATGETTPTAVHAGGASSAWPRAAWRPRSGQRRVRRAGVAGCAPNARRLPGGGRRHGAVRTPGGRSAMARDGD